MNLTLKVWRQKSPNDTGRIETYPASNIPEDCSFLEMLDIVNEKIITDGGEPIHFDHDCREGICGACSLTINGIPHGKEGGITTCQVHMRKYRDGDTIWIEPFRAKAFPIIRDLIVDRTSFDRIIAAGGYIDIRTGSAVDANSIPIPKHDADAAFDAAACIGCGACVASCKNASAMLFVAAKVSHLGHLPQGQPEREKRVLAMVAQMDAEGFGNCTNQYECEAACPKEISVDHIARMNRDYGKALLAEQILCMILPLGLALTLASGVAPATARWAQDQERRILAEGQPLAADALAFAAELQIEHPEEIRVMEVKQIPLPAPRPLVKLASRWGLPLFEPAGMALGRGIYLLEGQSRVLRHELVHVAQYQRLGGIESFMRQYLAECLTCGYFDAPLETEAREKQ